MEGMTTAAGCMRSPYPYALKHNPFAYYGGACPSNVVPIETLDADLAQLDAGNLSGVVSRFLQHGLRHLLAEVARVRGYGLTDVA